MKNMLQFGILGICIMLFLIRNLLHDEANQKCAVLAHEITYTRFSIKRWDKKIDQMHHNLAHYKENTDFVCEKVAREKLQLALPDETLYLFSPSPLMSETISAT